MMQRPRLLSLPWEVLSEIFEQLPTEDRLKTLPLICKPCQSFAVDPSTILQEVVLNDRVLSGPLRLPNLYSWFNHHGVAIEHLTLNGTLTFEGTYLQVDNIPGIPLIPSARRRGASFPVIGLIFSLCQNLECVIVEGCGRTITATGLSLLANCRRLHTLCITTTATKPHIGTQSLSALTCLHTLALHVQSGDRTIAAAEIKAAHYDAGRYKFVMRTCRNFMLQHSFTCAYADIFGSKDKSQHCLSHASKLTSIELSVNFLKVPPTFLGGASNLWFLDLSYKDFGSNSLDDLSTLIELTGLFLNGCQLTNFPTCTAQMGCMKELRLSFNNIANLPNDMPWDNLRVLHVKSNNLLDFPYSGLEAAPQFSYFGISNNMPLQVDKRLVSWTLSSSTRRSLFDIRKEGLTTSASELWNTESLRTIATLPQPTCTVQAALPEKS
ncbi:hypothetical protein WJX82_009462 [Trebouxia sp. C0006]